MCRVGSGSLEILTNHRFELLECAQLDIQLPLKVGTHLSFHLVDLSECKHTQADDTPGPVGMCVIADDLEVIINVEMKRWCPRCVNQCIVHQRNRIPYMRKRHSVGGLGYSASEANGVSSEVVDALPLSLEVVSSESEPASLALLDLDAAGLGALSSMVGGVIAAEMGGNVGVACGGKRWFTRSL